jgi:acetyl-CoA carboxylase biotin carboxyl carrier protein
LAREGIGRYLRGMDLQQVKVFVDAMAASDLAEMEASKDGWTLRLVRGAPRPDVLAAGPALPDMALFGVATAAEGDARAQHAPLSGIVYLQPAPGAAPFVQPGQQVTAGQTLCVIEAMKVFNEIPAERDGLVEAFLVESGREIEAGQPLVRFA